MYPGGSGQLITVTRVDSRIITARTNLNNEQCGGAAYNRFVHATRPSSAGKPHAASRAAKPPRTKHSARTL